jgi:hypothetical protein
MTIVKDINEFTDELQEGFYSKKILIEGDSWISHPFVQDLATQIDGFDSQDYLTLNIGEPGDKANSIFKSHGQQMKRLKRLLNTSQWGDTFDLIFISAAGNDLVGRDIIDNGFVKNKRDFPYLYGRELLTPNYYREISDVAKGYERFLNLRNTSALNEETPIITHTYSYLQPREVGTHIGPMEFGNGWVKKHFKHQGVADPDEQYDIISGMLDALYRRLAMIESSYANFLVVDTRKVLLKNGVPNLAWWYDEIHPNSQGFKRVAKYIRSTAQSAGLWNL